MCHICCICCMVPDFFFSVLHNTFNISVFLLSLLLTCGERMKCDNRMKDKSRSALKWETKTQATNRLKVYTHICTHTHIHIHTYTRTYSRTYETHMHTYKHTQTLLRHPKSKISLPSYHHITLLCLYIYLIFVVVVAYIVKIVRLHIYLFFVCNMQILLKKFT